MRVVAQPKLIISIVIQSALFVFLCCLLLTSSDNFSKKHLEVTIYTTLLLILSFFIKGERLSELNKQYFKVSNFFVLGFVIVHFQYYVDILLGYNDIYGKFTINPAVVNESSVLSALALCSFFIGYSIRACIRNKGRGKNNTHTGFYINSNPLRYILFVTFLCVIAFTPLSYFNAGYITVELPIIAAIFHKAFIYAVAAYLIVNSRKIISESLGVNSILAFIKFNGISVFLLLITFCMLILMSGDRGPIIQLGLAFLGIYMFTTRKKFSLITVCMTLVMASLFISLLSHIRHLEDISSPITAIKMSIERESLTTNNVTISPGTEELARSVRTVHAAIDYTNENGFSYGYYKALHVINLIPGLGSLIIPIFDLDRGAKSTLVITEHIGSDHGMGTSILADMWIDFGLIGIIVMFFFFGWFLRTIDMMAYSNKKISLFWHVLIISFLITSINLSRGTIFDSFKAAVMIYLFILIGEFIKSILPSKVTVK